jgi:adenylate cyclase
LSRQGSVTNQRPCGGPDDAAFAHAIRRHLGRLLDSSHFDASSRSREFLGYVVDEALAGRGAELSQATIAVAVFGRTADFDAILDPIVRVQAGRLRRSLERYYLLARSDDPIRIELPKGSYAPVFRETTPGDDTSRRRIELVEIDVAWPTVLVRPFAVAAARDGEIAAQVDDELARELCRHGDVRVVREGDASALDRPRATSVRFELVGTLRRIQDRRLIGARLIDRVDGHQICSDEYEAGPASDAWSAELADVPRLIAARIGSEQGVIGRVLAGEHAAGRRAGSQRFDAVAAYHHLLFSRDVAELAPTIAALEDLIARAPEVETGWTYLARLHLMNHAFELSEVHTPIGQGLKYANQAVLLDPTNARARCVLAAILLVTGELGPARDALEQTLRLNPHSLAHRESAGWLLALAGDWQRGMQVMRDAMARNPYCLPHVNHGLWAHHLRRGELEPAYAAALGYRDSGFFWRDLMSACCLGHLGRSHEAQASVAELLRAKPRFPQRGRTLIGHFIKPIELQETVVEGLEKAGLELAS